VNYEQTITMPGGTAPYAFSLIGTLPAGMTLSPIGLFSSTPTQTGIFDFIVQANDADGVIFSVNYKLVIKADGAFTFTS
jgi:hypothetical protein